MGIASYIKGVVDRATRKNPVRSDTIPLTMAPGHDRPPEGHLAEGAKHPVKLERAKEAKVLGAPDAPQRAKLVGPKQDPVAKPLMAHRTGEGKQPVKGHTREEPLYPPPEYRNPTKEKNRPQENGDEKPSGPLGSLVSGLGALSPKPFEMPETSADQATFSQSAPPAPAFGAPMAPADMVTAQTFWYPQ